MTFRLRLIIEWFIIALLANLTVISFIQSNTTSSFDNILYDGLSDTTRVPADEDILIIAIDDASLKENGKWPWDRSKHTELINKIKKLKPRSIVLDILLSDKGLLETDKALSEALYGKPEDNTKDSNIRGNTAPKEVTDDPKIFLPLHFVSPGDNGKAYNTILPTQSFFRTQNNIGHVNLSFDGDGILRRSDICFQTSENERQWPHLMELIYQNRHGKASPAMEKSTQKLCERPILLPFSDSGTIASIPYIEAAKGNILADAVKGKDVLIGSTALGLGDNYPTPSSEGGLIPGVEIMANILGALERDDFITPIPLWQATIILLFPIWILLIAFLRWQPKQILILSAIIFFGLFALSAILLYFGYWLAPGPALAALLLAYPLWGWRRLQAISYYMGKKLKELAKEEDSSPLTSTKKQSIDLIGKQRDTLDQAIDNIRDLRRFVNDTLSGLPDPMFVCDLEGKIILSNNILNDRIEANLVGKTLSDAIDTLVRPEDKMAVQLYIEDSIDDNNIIIDQEEIVRMDDSDTSSLGFVRFNSPRGRNFVMRRTPLLSNEGECRGHIHYLADISALARADAQREEMLQLLSHDMRAPQSAILALLDGKIDDNAKKSIATNSKRTLQLAQDFVEIARMGETPFDGEDILVDSLVEQVIDSLWPLAQERNVKINLVNMNEGLFLIGEADSLSRAIMNLLDNAIKFSPDKSEINVKIKNMDFGKTPMISITIEDQGSGIDDEMLPILFDRFTSNRSKEGRTQGIGLGLSFVSAVINRHNGSITADNKRNGGAIFSILLPESIEELEED